MAELVGVTAASIVLSVICFCHLSYCCYKFPSDMKDPCEDKKCRYGARCRPSLDGRTANCVCPDKCASYGDNRGSRPVCGTDGKDYGSVCELRRISCRDTRDIDVKFQGRCDPCEGVICPGYQECQLDENRNPICRCNSLCTKDVQPVCASDGKTYINECTLRIQACRYRRTLRIIYSGDCSKGVNPCDTVRCNPGQYCDIDHYGIATCNCPPTCEPAMRPVCGSDSVSYDSECELTRTACLQQSNVTMVHTGACGYIGACTNHKCDYGAVCYEKRNAPFCECPRCTEEFHPVCGTDRVSYINICQMMRESCLQRKTIEVAYGGFCNGCESKNCEFYAVCEKEGKSESRCICPQSCPAVHAPICGTDGLTYRNECEMRVSACKQRKKMTVDSRGPCDTCENGQCKYGARCENGQCVCPADCPVTHEPICANDGITYQNTCEMWRAACQQSQDLKVVLHGECDEMGLPLLATTGKACEQSVFGCCPDGKTSAQGRGDAGCPHICNCNRLGSYQQTCDPVSNQCSCKPGVGGQKCDRCDPGFWGLQQITEGNAGCLRCECNEYGSVRDDCEQMTGRCVCKPPVEGTKCDICPHNAILSSEGCVDASVAVPTVGNCNQLKCSHGAICHEKKGKSQCLCDNKCSIHDSTGPVCGSDGRIYRSECEMRLHSCRFQKQIQTANQEICTQDTQE